MEKKVLLIADDTELNRSIIKNDFSDEYEIFEAKDGQETLDVLNAVQVDAMILDIVMPKMDGLEVLRRVRSNPSFDNMVILVATATKEKNEAIALEIGADDVLSRPCEPSVIKNRLENLLAKKELEKDTRIVSSSTILMAERNQELKTRLKKDLDDIQKLYGYIRDNMTNKGLISECLDLIDKKIKDMRDICDR
ncbi:MAG: PleD family two-component system response regulator [Lachnospiraceae bacterium]